MTFTAEDAHKLLRGLRSSTKSFLSMLDSKESADCYYFRIAKALDDLLGSTINELGSGVNDVEEFKQQLSDLAVRVGYLESILYTGKADTYFESGPAAETEKRTVKRFYEGKL